MTCRSSMSSPPHLTTVLGRSHRPLLMCRPTPRCDPITVFTAGASSRTGCFSGGRGTGCAGDGVADVLFDKVGVDCDRGGGSFAGGGDDLCAWVGDVARDPDACNACASVAVSGRPAVVVVRAAELDEQLVVRNESRWDEECVEVNRT